MDLEHLRPYHGRATTSHLLDDMREPSGLWNGSGFQLQLYSGNHPDVPGVQAFRPVCLIDEIVVTAMILVCEAPALGIAVAVQTATDGRKVTSFF